MSIKICFELEADGANIEVDAEPGELLTQVASKAGVTIQQTCGGSPSCADCTIKVLEGAENAFEDMEFEEQALLGNVYFITKERLACQAKVKASSKIFVPDPKKIHKSLKRK